MTVTLFRPENIDEVFAIQRAAYKPLYEKYRDTDTSPYMESRETVLAKYTRPGTTGYVFREGERAVGAVRISISEEGKAGRVDALGVLPECQGRGIAQNALREIERLHDGVEVWRLCTILQEKGNCHLYEKLGYIRTGITEEINDRLTLVYYEKA